MIVTAHQPAYLPWLGLLHKAALADVFVLLDVVQFEKNSFINRNRVRNPDGCSWLTVPVLTKGHMSSDMRSLRIGPGPWARKHWTAFRMSYGRAPFFGQHAPFLEAVYRREWKLLVDLCEHVLAYLFQAFGVGARLVRASTLGVTGGKSALLLDICRKTGARVFVFGPLGGRYAASEAFEAEGVRVVFQQYQHPTYPQAYPGFVAGMNAFDLLLNVGPRSREVMMSGNLSREALR
jgi:hypothetical protein